MAQYFYDFGAYSTGDIATVSGGDWTKQYTNGWNYYQVESDAGATNGKKLVVKDNDAWGDQELAIVCDEAGATTGDIEIYARMSIGSVSGLGATMAFGIALITSTNVNDYVCTYAGSGTWQLWEWQFASPWSKIGSDATGLYTPSNGTYFKMRLGRSGSTIRVKIWADGEGEPGSWSISGTNTTYSSVKAGIHMYDASGGQYVFDVIGVGTAGDSAPTSSGGGGGSKVPLFMNHYAQQGIS